MILLNEGAYAYVMAQTALLNCRVAGMVAANQHRMSCGNSIMYGDDEFMAVEREFAAVIGHNAIMELTQS